MSHLGNVILYDKTRYILDDISFEDLNLAQDETFKLDVRGQLGDRCIYMIYSNPLVITYSESIRSSSNASVLYSFGELKSKLRTLPELIQITRITTRRYKSIVRECSSARAITKLLDTVQDDYTRVRIKVNHDAGLCITCVEIHKHDKYDVTFETSVIEEAEHNLVEFYKSVKTHQISMGHVKKAIRLICPYMWSVVSVITTKKTELFNIDDYELYSKIQSCPKVSYHDELLEISWKPGRLAMCIGEDEYRDIASRWGFSAQ